MNGAVGGLLPFPKPTHQGIFLRTFHEMLAYGCSPLPNRALADDIIHDLEDTVRDLERPGETTGQSRRMEQH